MPARLTTAAFLLVLLAACSSSEDDSGQCASRKGTYSMTFATRGGDCGDVGESIFNADQPDNSGGTTVPADAPCTGQIVNSDDNCVATMDRTCPVASTGGASKLAGKVTFSKDGSSGSGVLGIEIRSSSGTLECSGTYDVKFARQ